MPYLGMLVVAVIATVIGMLWYSPALFGNPWMRGLGFKKKDMNANGLTGKMVINFISTLIMAYCLSYLLALTGANTTTEAMQTGMYIWIGFILVSMINQVLWEKQKVSVLVINAGFWLVNILIASSVLVLL
jgi:hypothetical protein